MNARVVRHSGTGRYHALVISRDLLGDNVYSIYNGGRQHCKLVRTGLADRLDDNALFAKWEKRGYK